MTININVTYSVFYPEDLEAGEPSESGFIEEAEPYTFRELFEIFRCANMECSESPAPESASPYIWFSDYQFGQGTRDYYEKGREEERSYHPCDARAARYMLKAYRMAGGK